MRRSVLVLILAVFGIAGTAQSAIAQDRDLRHVTLQLQWHHQFQFAGYYAAVQQGFYRDAGFDVEIREADRDMDPIEAVADGEADFGVSTANLVVARSNGAPVVVLAPIFQHSPFAIITLRDRGLDNVQALAGLPLMIESHGAELIVYMQDEGLGPQDLNRLTHTHTIEPLVDGSVAGMSAYVTDEPFALREQNIPYNVITPRSGGIDFYGDTLFTSEAVIDADPDAVRAFRDASLKGWDYAMSHPEEIVDLILSEYSRQQTREHLMFEARETARLLLPDIVAIGHSNPGRWRHIADIFQRLDMLGPHFDVESFVFRPEQILPAWVRPAVLAGAAGTFVFAAMATVIGIMAMRLRREVAERRSAQAELERMALTDPLTGLDNRRSFFAHLERELSRAERGSPNPGLILLDLDRFKRLNDTFGHPAGDAALVAVAKCLHDLVRPSDVAARVGGEEFAILVANSAADAVAQIAERTRAQIEQLSFYWDGTKVPITASLGFARARVGESEQKLYERADHALMHAKETGRNRVTNSDDNSADAA